MSRTGRCAAPGCQKQIKARGYCNTHYQRLHDTGRLELRSFAERFWSNVDADGDCWEWTRALGGVDGYGTSWYAGRQRSAHRVAWMITNGEIPDDLFVCHHCDNRKCVRPDHLFLGTHDDNMRDMHRKGRNHKKLTADQVARIWTLVKIEGRSMRSVAKEFDTANTNVRLIVSGLSWKHVTEPLAVG